MTTNIAKKHTSEADYAHKLFLIVCLVAFVYRLLSICTGLSYWNDESHVALYAKNLSNGVFTNDNGVGTGLYQIAQYLVTALSFKLFGVSEFSGRLPSVICGLILIIAAYRIVNKLLRNDVAMLTILLLSFSQIQLAWSTQLRPYIWLELFCLLNIFTLYDYLKESEIFNRKLFYSLIIGLAASLFHGTGIINIGITLIVFVYKIFREKKYKYLFLSAILLLIIFGLIFLSFAGNTNAVSNIIFHFYFQPLHYRIFLSHNYWWLILGAILGSVLLFRKDKELSILLSGSVIFIFLVAIFKISPFYVRYSLPAFPLMYILFSYGLITTIKMVTKKPLLCWLLVALIFIPLSKTGKIILLPKPYYSINADVRENPIVDYKLVFSRIKALIQGKENYLVIDAWNDRVPWYLPGQKFIMVNKDSQKGVDPTYGEEYVGSLDGIKQQISKYKGGVVIVEDWPSFMSEDIKEYIRKNLKFEFTVQDLPYNENDHWGISVYSWGL